MKFLILDVYPSDDWRLAKDTAGGYGTGNDFDLTYKLEAPEVHERLNIVNSYILSNYKQFNSVDGYVIYTKK